MGKILRDRFRLHSAVAVAALLVLAWLPRGGLTDDQAEAFRSSDAFNDAPEDDWFLRPAVRLADGHRTMIGQGDVRYPVVVVRGTPYERGFQLGRAIGREMLAFVPAALQGLTAELGVSQEMLREVWARTAAFADDRVEQELAGLADGSGMPLGVLQAVHAVPLLMPYSCSSIAAWGQATEDGHLYQTRNLDWSLAVKAHEFPVIVVYLPEQGIAHVVPTPT